LTIELDVTKNASYTPIYLFFGRGFLDFTKEKHLILSYRLKICPFSYDANLKKT
jgi:hypothetical protein